MSCFLQDTCMSYRRCPSNHPTPCICPSLTLVKIPVNAYPLRGSAHPAIQNIYYLIDVLTETNFQSVCRYFGKTAFMLINSHLAWLCILRHQKMCSLYHNPHFLQLSRSAVCRHVIEAAFVMSEAVHISSRPVE